MEEKDIISDDLFTRDDYLVIKNIFQQLVDNQIDEVPMTVVTPQQNKPIEVPQTTVPAKTYTQAPLPTQPVQQVPLPMATPNMN